MRKIKIVIIGAGSATFGRGIIVDLMTSKKLKEFELVVSLVDIDKVALDRMHSFANILKEHYYTNCKIEAMTDRRKALPGANYVITSVAKDRWQLWEKEFYIPIAYGFRHVFGENGGPGAAFHTLRSLHLIIPIAKDMEELCPNALLINFTNPESRVCLGITKLTNIKTVGLCHGAFTTLNMISQILKISKEDIEITIGGINHFHWVLQMYNRSNKKDLYPEFRKRMQQSDYGLDSLTQHMFELFGLFTYPAASHIGEYVSFAYDIGGPVFPKWGIGKVARIMGSKESLPSYIAEGKPGQPSYELWSKDQVEKIQQVVEGRSPLTKELIQSSGEIAIPIICDIEFDLRRRELSVNILNDKLAISNLPQDAIVEISAQVGAEGICPIKVGPLPEVLAAICRQQISIQNLLIEAYRQRAKKHLLHALILEPVVDSIDRAEMMMEHLLKLEADYLPELH